MFNQLFLHYNRDADMEERHTTEQKQEQADFIDTLAETYIIQRMKWFLSCKRKLSVRFAVVVVHWQKLRDRFLKAIVTVAHNGLSVITVISHLTQPRCYCCGRGHSPRRCGSGSYLWGTF